MATKSVPALVRFEVRPDKFDGSTWCNRLEALLTFSHSSFQLHDARGDLRATPRGKLPCLRIAAPAGSAQEPEIIPDSLFAYEELIRRGEAHDLDVGLDEKQIALSRTIQSTVEELYWILTKERFVVALPLG